MVSQAAEFRRTVLATMWRAGGESETRRQATYIQITDISNIAASFLGLFLSQYPLKGTAVVQSVIISGQNSDFELHVSGITQYTLLYI